MKLRIPITAERINRGRSIRRTLTALVPWLILAHAVHAQPGRGIPVQWDPVDATKNIQSAIDRAVPPARIILHGSPTPWYVSDTIEINKDNIEIRILSGAKLMAKEGGFTATNASMFRIRGNNVKMNGYVNGVDASDGMATLEMRKADYQNPPYTPSGSRHCISVQGADNPIIQGFKLLRSGGDGITVNKVPGANPANHPYNVVIRDVICDDNHRQGISVISADTLTVTDCIFKNTIGTAPQSGLDIEPSVATDVLKEIKFVNCSFINNAGNNVEINLRELVGAGLTPVDITFEGCLMDDGPNNGMAFFSLNPDTGPTGTILVNNATISNMGLSGLRFSAWGVDRVDITMSDVWLVNCGFDDNNLSVRAPILWGTEQATVRKHGDVAFINDCRIIESYPRSDLPRNTLVWANLNVQRVGVKDITGAIVVHRPPDSVSALLDLGGHGTDPAPINSTLTVTEAP